MTVGGAWSDDDLDLMARAARMVLIERETKQRVAEHLGTSRFKVARLVDAAYELGMVQIEIVDSPRRVAEMEKALAEQYGLRVARVVRPLAGHSLTSALGNAAADVLETTLDVGGVLGIGWGASVEATVDALARCSPAGPVDVVQLSGGFTGLEPSLNPAHLATRAAQVLGGSLHLLHAPAFVDSPNAKQALLRQSAVAEVLEMFNHVTVAVQGIGSFQPFPSSALYRAISLSLRESSLSYLERALGDVFCYVFDKDGEVIDELSALTIAIPLDAIRNIPLRLGVAGGMNKTKAIRRTLDRGWINALVTDAKVAARLLSQA